MKGDGSLLRSSLASYAETKVANGRDSRKLGALRAASPVWAGAPE